MPARTAQAGVVRAKLFIAGSEIFNKVSFDRNYFFFLRIILFLKQNRFCFSVKVSKISRFLQDYLGAQSLPKQQAKRVKQNEKCSNSKRFSQKAGFKMFCQTISQCERT